MSGIHWWLYYRAVGPKNYAMAFNRCAGYRTGSSDPKNYPMVPNYPTFPMYWGTGKLPIGRSGLVAVAEVYDAVAKAALVHQLEIGMDAGGQGTLAATN